MEKRVPDAINLINVDVEEWCDEVFAQFADEGWVILQAAEHEGDERSS